MIKLIIFDLGGIVVPEKGEQMLADIAGIIQSDPVLVREKIMSLHDSATRGEITILDIYNKLISELQIMGISSQQLLDATMHLYEKYSGAQDGDMLEIIEKLKEHYRVVCLSNTEVEIEEFNRKTGLFDQFHKAYISTQMHMKKPDPEIFQAVLKEEQAEPRESIMVDDNKDNIKTADKLGINVIHFQDRAQFLKELLKYSIILD
jgi:putative hydrolase of the HAD superfamily